MSADVSADNERWAAVGKAVRRRMAILGISAAELARRVRSSETTIHNVAKGNGRHNESMLVAISAVLDWPTNYLVRILSGEADENTPPEAPLERHIAKLTSEFAALAALQKEIAVLKSVLHGIDKKIDVLVGERHAGDGGPESL